ncbi:hypothetical protein SteCoe_25121 [Stentor coeruleus]|uniref:Uncharacterized protein n=1 Tax=Stentor coeruleus TaxID=5963 RepID=A0A1R2BFY1_9CILI|nr:hypothetical protein SteCoe_25121 [Stentor coeruleus]
MSEDITDEQWKAKFYEEKKKCNDLEKLLLNSQNFLQTKIIELEMATTHSDELKKFLKQSMEKCERKKDQIALLKDDLNYKNKEIKELRADLEFVNEKNARLRKHRHQSVFEIRDLEVKLAQEDEKMSILTQTPKSCRKKEKFKKLSIQTQESASIKFHKEFMKKITLTESKLELERLLEIKEDELSIEFQKSRELINSNLKLKHELFMVTEDIKNLQDEKRIIEQLSEEIKQTFHSKIETFKEKISILVRENEDLKITLKEYQERDSAFDNSEHESIGNLGEELSKVSGGSRFIEKSFEDYLLCHEFSHFQLGDNQMILELKRKNHKLEELLRVSNSQAKKLNEKLLRYKKVSEILNTKLKESLKILEDFKNNCDVLSYAYEVKKLTEEKERLQEEVTKYKHEISINITKESHRNILSCNRSYLEDLSSHNTVDMMCKTNCPSRFQDERRRNIASWGYNLLSQI